MGNPIKVDGSDPTTPFYKVLDNRIYWFCDKCDYMVGYRNRTCRRCGEVLTWPEGGESAKKEVK